MDTPPNRQTINGDDNIQIGKIANSNVYINTPPPPPDTPITPHQIPSPPSDFVGREQELDELTGAVLRQGKTILGVHGLGGIGKTALVYKLADRLAEHYPGGSILVDMNGTDEELWLRPEQAMAQIVYLYLPTARLPEELGELQKLYRSVLDNRRVILLFDNARGEDQLSALLPPPRGCLALMTSRARFPVAGMVHKHLEELPETDAVALLREIEPRIDAHAAHLAHLCGYLPMALRISASQLQIRVNLSPKELCDRLSDENRLQHLGKVQAALEVSYQMLPEPLQEKWRRLGVFAADFDEDTVPWVWGMITNETSEEQGSLAREEASDILGKLIAYSLVEFEDGRFRLHDLARLFACNKMGVEEVYTTRLAHARYYKDLLWTCDRLYIQGNENIVKGLALIDREQREINAGQSWAASATDEELERLELVSEYPNAGIYLFELRLLPCEQIKWLDAGLRAARILGQRDMEAAHLDSLGLAYIDLGNPHQSIKYYKQALDIVNETGNQRVKGNTLNNLGLAYKNLGDHRRAIRYYDQALVILDNIGDRRGKGTTLSNLGVSYRNLGDYHRAIEYYDQALIIKREIRDQRGEGITLGNLGVAYWGLGDVHLAIKYYDQQLNIDRRINALQGEVNTLINLGIAYAHLGDKHQAIEYYDQALSIASEIGYRRGEALGSWNLGEEFEKQGKLTRAVELMQVRVDFEREIGHAEAEKHAALVEAIRARMREG